jgi:rubrerythrin
MSETALDALSLPRRVAAAELLAEIVRTEHALAELYDRFAAGTALPHLRGALAELAAAKRAHVRMLEPLLGALHGDARAAATAGPAPATLDAAVERRSEAFAQAFQGERALEVAYRELAGLLGDLSPWPDLPRLAAESARHRRLLRDLYVRYS